MKSLSSKHLVDKSIAAMTAAIEIYNKPNFEYKEESFAILAVNAWELLFKARILQQNNNDIQSLVRKGKPDVDNEDQGAKSSNMDYSHPQQTIGMREAIDAIQNLNGEKLPAPFFNNLKGLLRIRNDSIHLPNMTVNLRRRIHEIGLATVNNYAKIMYRWFQLDILSVSSMYLPLAFNLSKGIDSVLNSEDEENIINILDSLKSKADEESSTEFAYAVCFKITFQKSKSGEGLPVHKSSSEDAFIIQHKEEEMLDIYIWEYSELKKQLVSRYSNFKQDRKYIEIRMALEGNSDFCYKRYPNPKKLKGTPKKYYHPDILKEFDKFYSKVI